MNVSSVIKYFFKKAQGCGDKKYLKTKPNTHSVNFKATEKKHRYKIITHGKFEACTHSTCYAAYKKCMLNGES